MTADEIIEAQKLIAGLRDDLSLIASSAGNTADAENLADLVLEKVPRMADSSAQLSRCFTAWENEKCLETWNLCDKLRHGVATIWSRADMTKQRDRRIEEK